MIFYIEMNGILFCPKISVLDFLKDFFEIYFQFHEGVIQYLSWKDTLLKHIHSQQHEILVYSNFI